MPVCADPTSSMYLKAPSTRRIPDVVGYTSESKTLNQVHKVQAHDMLNLAHSAALVVSHMLPCSRNLCMFACLRGLCPLCGL